MQQQVQWTPNPVELATLSNLLSGATTGDSSIQLQIMNQLASYSSLPDYPLYLSHIFAIPPVPSGAINSALRGIAGISLKNTLKTQWTNLDDGRLAICKGLVLGALADNDEMVRKVAGSIITTCVDGGLIERWPEVMPKLLELIRRPDTMIGAFGALEKICEDSCLELDEKDANFTTSLFPALFPHISSPSPLIRSHVLKCTNHFLMAQSSAFSPHFDTYMNILYNCTSDPSPLVKRYVCQAFNSVVECRPDVLVKVIENVVAFMLHVMKEEDKKAGLEAADFFLIFAEEDSLHIHMQPYLPRYLIIVVLIGRIVPVLLTCMVYSPDEVAALKAAAAAEEASVADRQQDMTPRFHKGKVHELAGEKPGATAANTGRDADGSDSEGDDESEGGYDEVADEWNIRKCSAAALDLFSNVFGDDLLPELLPQLTQMLAAPQSNWTIQEAAILALGAVAQGCRRGMTPHLSGLVPHLLSMLDSPEPLIRSIACWTLGRYCSWIGEIPENIQHDPQQVIHHRQTYFMPFLRQILKICVDSNKQVQKSGMSTLSSLFEDVDPDLLIPFLDHITQTIVACFSTYQKKNTLTLLDALSTLAECVGSELGKPEHVNMFMPPLIAKWSSIPDDDYDMFPMLECLCSVSVSLEAGFQPYAAPVWARCMVVIKNTMIQAQQYAADSSMVIPDKDFIVVSLDLISGIIQALGVHCEPLVLDVSQGGSLYDYLKYTMRDSSHDVRSSSFAILGDLCQALFHTVVPHIDEIMELAVGNMEWRPESAAVSAMNNATWAAGEIAIKHKDKMEPYVPVLLAKLVPLLMEARTPRSLRENAAITIGRLGLVCPPLLAPQLEHYIQRWCEVLSTVHDNQEKATAFQGICNVIRLNPNSLVPSFEAYCNAIAKWNVTDLPELKQIFLEIFQLFKNAMGVKWQPTVAGYSPLVQNSIHQVYGL